MSAHESRVVSIGQHGSTDPEPSAASSEHSLSMMRQAFGGLLANTERSMSSRTDQRGELERPSDGESRLNRAPNAFHEEKYSYDAVRESRTDISSSAFEPAISSAPANGFAHVSSVEFFDYLTAIGGL
jgi:hypothetical protein